jgi:hypothetical protein
MKSLLVLAAGCLLLSGCAAVNGSGSGCTTSMAFSTEPATATANHSAAPPGNQQKFTAQLSPTAPAGCPIPALSALAYPTWNNPDALDITISSAPDATNGVATCNSSTSGAVTLTATEVTVANTYTSSVQLTCQ